MEWTRTAQSNIFWNQVKALTLANLKSRYRKTFAGFIWVVLNPLIIYGVQSLIFTKVLRLQIPEYHLFLLSGLLPWIFISQSLEMGVPLIQNSGPLLKAFPTHPLVYVCAQLLDNLINFAAAFLLILLPFIISDPKKLPVLLLLPLPFVTLALGVTALAWGLATLQVFFRDTRYILTFVLSISFFLTPIFYPVHFLPESLRWAADWNPFYILIAPFRNVIYDFDLSLFVPLMMKALAFSASALALALVFWKRRRNALYFNI